MFSDLVNYLTVILLISYLIYFNKLNIKIGLILACLSSFPIFLIGTIIPIDLVSDVIQYTLYTQHHRAELGLGASVNAEDFNTLSRHKGLTVDKIGFIYALVPIPFIDNFKSIGFSNKFLLILLISYIYSHKDRRDYFIIFFLLFFPSIIFYSSTGLKDTLVLVTMVPLAFFIVEKNLLATILFLFILYIFRTVNVILLVPIISVYFIVFSKLNINIKLFIILFTSIIALIFLYIKADSILDSLNNYRLARAYEDVFAANPSIAAGTNIYIAGDFYQLTISILTESIRFFVLPSLFNADSLFEKIQSIENIFIIVLLSYLFYKLYLFNKMKCLFWILSLLFIAGIYGYVQTNVGTLVRYKFVFIAMFVTIIVHEIKFGKLKE